MSRERVVVLAPEPIRPRMAGMGIRALELARALATEFDSLLLVPNDAAEAREAAGEVPVQPVSPGTLAGAARGARAAVVSGHAATAWFERVPDLPVAADLYDPFMIENLHYATALGDGPARHDLAAFGRAAARADLFLCASPEQRLFYAGALYAARRIGTANFPDDPTLSRLLAVVPFGVPRERAAGDRARGRLAAGVPADGPLVLFGGIYDWYDPGLLLDAWPEVRAAVPGARLLFFESPNPETTPQVVYSLARDRARVIDPRGDSIAFSAWMPYSQRADLYAACDVMVSLSQPGLETDLAYRTRLLDAAWGGVPCVASGGGGLARELEGAGACIRFAARPDPRALAAAIRDQLARRSEAGDAARRFAATRAWPDVAAPLLEWCRGARPDAGRRPIEREAGSRWARLRRRPRR